MLAKFFLLTVAFSSLFNRVNSIENKAKFIYKGQSSFREELVITNATSNEDLKLGQSIRKWKSITLDDKSYAIGLSDTGICLITTRGNHHTSVCINITDEAIKVLDVQLHKIWNTTTNNFEPSVLVLLEGGSLSWFKTNENLNLESLSTLELEKDAFQFDVYTIEKISYLFVLNRNVENNEVTLDIYKASVMSSKYKYLWPEQSIKLEAPTRSFTLSNQGSNYYLSIAQETLHHVKIYKKIEKSFMLQWSIPDTDSDDLQSFSIGPKSYILTNGKNSGIYRITNHGPIKDALNENNVSHWLPIPLVTYRDEIFLLAQKEIHHDGHIAHSIELIHSTGFDFTIYHEIPCFYYQMSLHGLDCLVEEDEHHAELNTSAIISFEDAIGLVISGKDLHPHLFMLNVDVKPIPNPKETRLNHLFEIKNKLELMQDKIARLKSVKDNVSVVESTSPQKSYEAKTRYSQPRDSKVNFEDLKEKYDDIKETVEKLKNMMEDSRKNGGFTLKKITVNGNVEVEGSADVGSVETKKLNGQDTMDIMEDTVRKNFSRTIGGRKIFQNLTINNLIFNTLNGIDRNQFIFKDNETSVTLRGNMEFKGNLEVIGNIMTTSKKVNNINLEDEVIHFEKPHDKLLMDSIKITGNLEVDNINSISTNEGFPFNFTQGYLHNITLENLNLEDLQVNNVNSNNFAKILDDFTKNGTTPTLEVDILNASNAKISFLNDLKFPDDFVLDNSSNIHITGKKTFEGEVQINSLAINGLVNGINTSDIFALGKSISLKNMDVMEPTESRNISTLASGDIVDYLEVDGSIIIKETIDDIHVGSYLNNILWKNLENANINSTKFFNNLTVDNLNVTTINNIPNDDFINKSQNQTLSINQLEGNLTIENLYIQGKIDGIDINDLLENSVKLSGNQNISSFLTFSKLEVGTLNIVETLNKLIPSEYLFTNGEKRLSLEKVNNIKASNIAVEGEVFGKIDGFDIDDFEKRVLRKNGPQEISGDIYVDELYVDHLDIGKINGYYTRELFDLGHFLSLMEALILEGKVGIKNVTVLGNFTFENINNLQIKDVLNSLTFTKENELQSSITFRDNVDFNHIQIKNFNGIPFKDFLSNIVFKNETDVKIRNSKTFMHGIKVNRYIETNTLNGIELENILRKGNSQKIAGPIIINGDVTIEDDIELHKLNGVLLQDLQQILNIFNDKINITGDFYFNESVHINNLDLQGYFNDHNLTEILKNSIGATDDVSLEQHFVFTNKVLFKKDFDVAGTFNDLNLSENYNDIVLINEDDYIEGSVSFKDPVEVKGTITVESDLLTNTIMGIDPHDWYHHGVFIDKGIKSGNVTFENITVLGSITANFINNMNTSRFIPLQVDQSINKHFIIQNVRIGQRIDVSGLVNRVDLYPEYLNTVLNQGMQNITSKVKFNGNVVVYDNLVIRGKVNKADFNQVAFIKENQTLHDQYIFLNVTANYLEIDGLINGINFSEWQRNALKKHSNRTQNISDSIKMNNLIIDDYSYGSGLISGLNLTNLSDIVAYKLKYKGKTENNFRMDFRAACKDVNYLARVTSKQIFKFKYFEHISSISFKRNINFVHYLEHNSQHYLIVNEKHSCESHILHWTNYKEFTQIQDFNTGVLEQIIYVRTEREQNYIIGRSSNCSMPNTNLWIFTDAITDHQILDDATLLQESLIPNTFYALTKNEVREYKITSKSDIYVYRKWKINVSDNMAFIPRGLKIGLALRDGQKIIKLERNDEAEVDFDYDVQETLLGQKATVKNRIIPGKNGEMAIINVGKQKETMVAILSKEASSIKTKSDSIKIYSDIFKGTLFHKIFTYKATSLTSLEFGNGETLLVFLENHQTLQVFAYRGIEGFQHVNSAKMRGQRIIKMKLPISFYHSRNVLAIINNNELKFIDAIMIGNDSTNIRETDCDL